LISDGIAVSSTDFERQVSYFARHFHSITMDTLIDCVENDKSFPENAIVFSFDDGYADNYQAAAILKRHDMTGVFYITAGCIEGGEPFWVSEIRHLVQATEKEILQLQDGDGVFETGIFGFDRSQAIRRLTRFIKTLDIVRRECVRDQIRQQLNDVPPLPDDLMLNWQQLREMVDMGMEIGGHTVTHCNLPSASELEAWEEIRQGKIILERKLGVDVRHFAYPNGGSAQYYNTRIKAMVQRAGYVSAVTSRLGIVNHTSDCFELRRMRTTEELSEVLWGIEEFRLRSASS
jgi:peptidoglycan/xylan/chitin deacetylase (PgdA/CDA1 family)